MQANKRREEIAKYLKSAGQPVSASALASIFGVSRQAVVGDIALLRAGGTAIFATPRGYLAESSASDDVYEASFASCHTADRMAQELYLIIDLGGGVLDVTVEHSVYGQLSAPLHLFSRYDVDLFLEKVRASGARPLCALTDGVHLHRIRCRSEADFVRITAALAKAGFLAAQD